MGKNQSIGITIQERVAVEIENILEREFPDTYMTHSNGTRFADIPIIEKKTKQCIAKCEVKSAKEYIPHIWREKITRKILKKFIRRGMFDMKPEQLNNDIYAFVIRFVDIDREKYKTYWNGDIEVFYALNDDVNDYLIQQPLNCKNWKLCIDKLPLLNAEEDFMKIFNEVINKNEGI